MYILDFCYSRVVPGNCVQSSFTGINKKKCLMQIKNNFVQSHKVWEKYPNIASYYYLIVIIIFVYLLNYSLIQIYLNAYCQWSFGKSSAITPGIYYYYYYYYFYYYYYCFYRDKVFFYDFTRRDLSWLWIWKESRENNIFLPNSITFYSAFCTPLFNAFLDAENVHVEISTLFQISQISVNFFAEECCKALLTKNYRS